MAAVIAIVIIVLLIAGQWKLFVKAGEPGWASIIPFYSTYIMYKICWNSKFFWLAKAFGKGVGFTLGLIFLQPIFMTILGFDDSDYMYGINSYSTS